MWGKSEKNARKIENYDEKWESQEKVRKTTNVRKSFMCERKWEKYKKKLDVCGKSERGVWKS